MSKWMLTASAAALAIAAPALAEKGGHQGHGNGGGPSMKAERGNGGGGQRQVRADRGGERQQVRTERRGGGNQQVRAERRGNQAQAERRVQRIERIRVADERNSRVARANDRAQRIDRQQNRREAMRMNNVERHDRQAQRFVDRGNERAAKAAIKADDKRAVRFARFNRDDNGRIRVSGLDRGVARNVPRWSDRGLVRAFGDGCPPGLAMKNNGCLPPGQAKKIVGTRLSPLIASGLLEGPYSQWYRDDDRYLYRWDDDYIYRVRRDNDLVDAFFPYANRDYYYYPVGMSYPSYYNYYNVPYQYQSYYPDGGDYWYRYGDGAIYQVNPSNGLVSGIVALLAGDLAVGQRLPPAYSVYNVPYGYRDRYYDTPDAWYRYNDGYIYQVDPTTQLITAVINAIV